MNKINVPFVPLVKEDEIVEKIVQMSAEEPYKQHNLNDDSEELELILIGMGMEKYIELFIKSKLDLIEFLSLNESDLRELGITDPKDIETLSKNIQVFHTKKKAPVVDKSLHDLQIARNISNELLLLQNYCSYLELQMRKHKLTDYRINFKESASTYLKAFTEAAFLQVKILSQKIFNTSGDDHLIGKALKVNNLVLPDNLKEKMNKKKSKGRFGIFNLGVILGIFPVIILIKNIF